MSSIPSLSMATSIIMEATGDTTQAALTVVEYTSTTAPVAIFTSPTTPVAIFTSPVAIFTSGSPTGSMPEYTGPASTGGSSSSGLSVGAKAGVGVGVVVGVLVLAALLWFAYTMGKRRARAAPSNPPDYDGVIHEEGKHSKVTLYSVNSATPSEKASTIDKAHDTKKFYARDVEV